MMVRPRILFALLARCDEMIEIDFGEDQILLGFPCSTLFEEDLQKKV
jgi:hypothetical protein